MSHTHTQIEEATREESRVALVTCTELRDLDPDDRLLFDPLAALGVRVDPVPWDAAGVDWAAYDLAVLRSTWDYAVRRDEFVAWAQRVPRLANPADVVAWNTDKRYLAGLAAAGVPVVPTTWVPPGAAWSPPPSGDVVVKPAVSAGSLDTGRYRLADPDDRALAAAHVARLQAADRTVMVQPYLAAVDTHGETALMFLAVAGLAAGSGRPGLAAESGRPSGLAYSHAVRKGPMLTGPDVGVDGLFKPEEITARTPADAERGVAERALAMVPGGPDRLLYARVDVIPGEDGTPVLVELELTEPSLFMAYADGAADRLAAAIASRARGARSRVA